MRTDADRGQSIQIGAVLLFGILIVFLATWQAMVVPQENEDVEFDHNLQVQNDVQELRNAIVSTSDGGGPTSVDVRLGTAYPTRVLFVNPGPPSGSLRTVGTASDAVNLSLQNVAAAGDAGDFWDGSDRNYTTGGLVYTPNYNIYEEAPATFYENSVLYNDFGERNLTVAGQTLIDGNRITLVTLNGSLSEARSGATSVDVRPVTASRSRLGVVNSSASNRVTLAVPTHLSAADWSTLLEEQFIANGGHVYSVSRGGDIPGTDLHVVKIHMERDVSYRLGLARVGVGTSVDTDVPAAYLTRTMGNGSVVPEGSTTALEVRIWDRFNNPVGGVSVDASTTRPDSDVGVTDVSDEEGRVELQYEAPPPFDGGAVTDEVNVSFTVQPSAADENFDPETPQNVTFDLTVDNTDGSGAGDDTAAYEIAWDFGFISTQQGIQDCFSSNDTCVYDLADDTNSKFDMKVGTTPSVTGAFVDFNRNNTYGTLDPKENNTDGSGDATTELDVPPSSTGVTQVNASTTEDNDGVTIKVIDSGGAGGPTITNPTATDRTDGNGVVTDSHNIRVSADVADPDGVSAVTADASDFGGSASLSLTDGNNDDTYEATFTVDGAQASSDGTYSIPITATDTNGDSNSATTNGIRLDTDPPSVTTASITNTTISDADTGVPQTVTVNFDEDMDTGVSPNVEIIGLASSPYTISGSWSDETTWTGEVTIGDDEEETTGTIAVESAEDVAGNTQDPSNDTSNTFLVDTRNPSIAGATTRDTDGDGQIDRIELTYTEGITSSSTALGDYSVSGYSITSFADDDGDGTLHLELTESGTNDTGTTPTVSYTQGSTADSVGNLAPDQSLTPSDGAAPVITNFTATNPSGMQVQVTFDASEALSTIDVAISGTESATLDETDFTESCSGGICTYTGTYVAGSYGSYTATLNSAADGAGNDGASGQSDSVTIAMASAFSINDGQSGTVPGDNSDLTFLAANNNSVTITITGIAVNSTSGAKNAQYVEFQTDEEFEGGGGFHEGRINVGGAAVTMNQNANIAAGSNSRFWLGKFIKPNGQPTTFSGNNAQATVTIYFQDGSEVTTAIPASGRVPGANRP